MITGIKRQELTLDTVLNRISEYDIFRHYLQHDFELGKPFSSPFRNDPDPSFSIIQTKKGRLHFTDFGGNHDRGKVTDFVRKVYPGRNYNDILQCIDRDLQLGIVEPSECHSLLAKPAMVHETKQPKQPPLIQVATRNFTRLELSFWNLWHLDRQDLKMDPVVYAIDKVYIDKKLIPFRASELVFGYLYDDRYWKIYKPLAKSRKEKWISNVPHDLMYGTSDLVKGQSLLITKAHKDCKVLRKVMSNVCGTQYEGTNVISPSMLSYFQTDFPHVYLNFDPDFAGRQACNYYVTNHGLIALDTPQSYKYPHIKDLADVGRYRGLDFLGEYVNKKIALI